MVHTIGRCQDSALFSHSHIMMGRIKQSTATLERSLRFFFIRFSPAKYSLFSFERLSSMEANDRFTCSVGWLIGCLLLVLIETRQEKQ